MSDTEKPSWVWRKETEALKQQLAEVTQEREQCVRDMSGWMDNGETLSQAICAMRLSASTVKQQLATVTEQKNTAYCEVEIQLRKLANMTKERDEQCAGKMAFFEGMNDMREQRTALERQLFKVTRLATHIGRLGETSHTVVHAAIQQLADMTKEREEARDMAACLLFFGPTFPADVAWAEMQIAKMKHEKGLP